MVGGIAGKLVDAVQEMLPEDREEARWIARAQAGDAAAIDRLITRYRQQVVRLAAHILRRPEEAEDVAQEAFVRAFRNLRSFRGECRFYTWLYAIVVRICLDRRRLARWDAETPVETLLEPIEEQSPPVEGIETRLLVETLLDRLSPPMRAMLVLRELEGLEYEEIARVLAIPVGRVRWRLHAARAQFRALWQSVMQEIEHV
ncbi:MAG TPA: RNA polymerase sigma factor [Chthonomonadaceae bacterium]|nr:RNA polymerase sigma factor [Chthonomonadaceae bacterium]